MAFANSTGIGFFNRFVRIDEDVDNFINAASINNAAHQNSLLQLVLSLKSQSLWNKLSLFYPFIGGTSSSHSYNLINPNLYNILWSTTGVTHDSNGITGNGLTGYGNTTFKTDSIINNISIGCYIRNDITTGYYGVWGTYLTDNQDRLVSLRLGGARDITMNSVSKGFAYPNTQGLFTASRNTSIISLFHRTSSLVSSSYTSTTTSDLNLYLLGLNYNNTGVVYPSPFNLSCFFISQYLTPTEVILMNSIIQNYQIALGRHV